MAKLTKVELMEIALLCVEKGYNSEQLMDGDDLYYASSEEKEDCVEYWVECREIGLVEFRKKISTTKEDKGE